MLVNDSCLTGYSRRQKDETKFSLKTNTIICCLGSVEQIIMFLLGFVIILVD